MKIALNGYRTYLAIALAAVAQLLGNPAVGNVSLRDVALAAALAFLRAAIGNLQAPPPVDSDPE